VKLESDSGTYYEAPAPSTARTVFPKAAAPTALLKLLCQREAGKGFWDVLRSAGSQYIFTGSKTGERLYRNRNYTMEEIFIWL